jgi:hypothetical protein
MVSRSGCVTGLTLAIAVGALAGRAEAQEYCVACTEPSAVYRCVIDGARPGGGQSLQMLCVTSMAKEGHATCGTARDGVHCDGGKWRAYRRRRPVETPGSDTA